MSQTRNLLFIAVACTALLACRKEAEVPTQVDVPEPVVEEIAPGQPSAPPLEPPADAVVPVTVSADAVKVGSSLGSDQGATAAKRNHSLNDTVYASARVGGAASGSTAYVYWTYQDGMSHKEEQKPVSGSIVNFDFKRADGMKAGRYNVEIGVDDKPIGIVDFVVQ